MVSINTNYSTTYPTGSTKSSTGTTNSTEETLFGDVEVTGASTTDKETAELEAKLAAYQAQKQELETKLQQYKQEKSQLEARNAALEAKATQLESEIKQVEADRESYEAQAKEQKEKYEQDNITLLSVIKKMNEKINETTQTVAQAAQEEDKKIEDATAEAFKKYEAGEITEDEIPAYIAQRSGNQNLIDQLATAGLNAVNSFSSQVKTLIAQMSQTLNYLNQNKVNIETASEKINNSNAQLTVVREEQAVVQDDIETVDTKINSTQSEINKVDVNIKSVQNKLSGTTEPTNTETQNGQNNYTVPEQSSNPFAGAGNDLGLDLDSFISVTTTIDFRGFKAALDAMMTQNNQSVENLRERIQEQRQQKNQQKNQDLAVA